MTRPEVVMRPGALNELGAVADRYGAQRIWLVTGRTSYAASGAEAIVEATVGSKVVGRFTDYSENPTIDEVRAGVQALRATQADLVVAIGGGAPMDVAKQVKICAANDGDPADYITGRKAPERDGVPLVACPTTAGTGSEVTHFAVCYDGLKKYSFAHPSLVAAVALVDPDLTASLPREQAASCALDALSQLIESYWAVGATVESRRYSEQGIKLFLPAVRPAVNENDAAARAQMAEAAHLSGKAIDIAKTTAAHAVSYPISQLWGVAHGHAVMMTLPEFVVFNSEVTDADCLHPQGAAFVAQLVTNLAEMFGVADAEGLRTALLSLMADIGLHRDFARLGICSMDDAAPIITHVNLERVGNNPRRVAQPGIERVLRSAMAMQIK